MRTRGAVDLIVIGVIAIAAAIGVWAIKPRSIDGDSRRADASAEATRKLEEAVNKQGAEAAASVTKIGEANASAPESREKTFIEKEVQVVMTKLPAADPKALIEAERRKVAILEGKVEESGRLYELALKHSRQLQQERDEAVLYRRQVDEKLAEIAALRLGEARQRNQMFLALGAAILIILYLKLTHFSPGTIRKSISDIRNNVYPDPVTAIDVAASPLQQKYVNLLSRFWN